MKTLSLKGMKILRDLTIIAAEGEPSGASTDTEFKGSASHTTWGQIRALFVKAFN
jgi:hypothetical protein